MVVKTLLSFVPGFVWNLLEAMMMNIVAPVFMPLVEANLVPTFLIRFAVKSFLGQRLVLSDQGSEAANMADKMRYIKDLRSRPIAEQQKAANQQHYEVPTPFYDLCLGPWKKYSCGLWEAGTTTLEESEERALALVATRARMDELAAARTGEPRPRVLDLGCGWGSVTLYLATHFPHVDITCVSNSTTQRAYITEQARRRGLTNVTAITDDAAKFSPPAGQTYDRVVSVEMLEHMKNYEALFGRISTWLRPGGLFFAHIFTHRRFAYHFEEGWMAERFFTGGQMPSNDLFAYFQRDLRLRDQWVLNGMHYKKTCDAWLDKLDSNKDAALRLFADSPNPTKEFVDWRLFFIVCGESFAYADGEEWQVSHYLFERPEDARAASAEMPVPAGRSAAAGGAATSSR
ncbi:hypothetical protein FNF27_02570 [Cafeteria roenbergensis]|uniref:Methyltransferase domain-containing protein n=2 Tax=Cafeteria roenbergensis TaxID=33653 RepID=A0A5A8EE65_CAFRO|nr:hypothetical protein FNF29_06666 [Cafeteria roenbergensis]KAA0175849.1 hypothetical protein FNF27_02570 [Cafeteria roenbergensis]|eukprot:KAA0148448.1 hypothetical protein FNF29_06666 [Cafeteria roenbergensis]